MRRAFTLLELIIVLLLILILTVVLFPVFARRPFLQRRLACQANSKQIGVALLQYVQDYNGRLPPTQIGTSRGWSEVAWPYIKNWTVFQCPATQRQTTRTTDYFFNSRLSGGRMTHIQEPTRILLLGDGDDDMPVSAHLSSLPPHWLRNRTSPAWRHFDTANYLFVDGHVKAFKPNQISVTSPKTARATFAIR